ncbi:snRNA-activating protein complex subunit 3 [Onthophagus taurus]|uniref:snRNA-activating protein complex subunit 3 n=1 Tax=Onthophagus taurus TaxID=166361 RepID=UPI000C20AE3A|nr:snRNA-activating protein complex subunit 3 [Onthophagus taurus]
MESIYPPNTFMCTEKLTYLKEHFQEFSNDYSSPIRATLQETHEKLFGDILSEDFEKLTTICNVDNLTVHHEFEPSEMEKFYKNSHKDLPEDAKKLHTIQAKISWENKYNNVSSTEPKHINLLQDFNESIDFEPGSDVIITVNVHQPYTGHIGMLSKRNYCIGFIKSCHELIALGSQSLKDLKNKIICDHNEFSKEVNDIYESNKDDETIQNGSSLICIDDKLYVDMPNTDSIDYSVVVKKWNEDNKLKLNFTTDDMSVKLRDLNFRLGYPYLYQHNGNCEHLFVFSDVQLVKKCHSLCRDDYPYYKTINGYMLKNCNICKKVSAKWICTNNNRLIHNVTYFCQDCLISYNYKDGEKIGDFKLYPQKKILIQQ